MSINDLIHTNAHNAFEQGVKTERERIIKLLKENDFNVCYCAGGCYMGCYQELQQELISLIKEERMTTQELIEGVKRGVAQMNRVVIKGEQK